MSAVRQNYHKDCEDAINEQINMELNASYIYQSMAYHFDRDDVALEGVFKYFKKNSDEEREHAEMFMKYQNMRGGRIVLKDVKAPTMEWTMEWDSHIHALEGALELEKKVNESLLKIHATAGDNGDAHLCDFLEENFLDEQVKSINEIAKLIVNAKRCGEGLGVYQFNKLSMG